MHPETRASVSFVAGCVLLATAILAATFARSANPPPRALSAEEIRYATGGATLCGNNPFCGISNGVK